MKSADIPTPKSDIESFKSGKLNVKMYNCLMLILRAFNIIMNFVGGAGGGNVNHKTNKIFFLRPSGRDRLHSPI